MPVSKFPLREGGTAKGRGMDPPRRGGSCEAAEGRKKPCIPDHKKDFSTHQSCSDFDSVLKQHAATARNDGGGVASYIRYTVFTDVALSV